MKNKFNENKGITLIALVITILVMLILASISISLVVGEDGVIERAKEAKKRTEIEEIVERVELAKQAILIPKKVNSDSSIISMEEFRDEILKEFDLEEKDTNRDAIIELESEYVILVFPELEYRVIDKYELDSYLYVEPKEDRWKIDDYGYISFKGTDTEIIIPKKIGDKVITEIEGSMLGFINTNVKSVIIPSGVTKIANNAFRFCHYMNDISIPEGVIIIGDEAFFGCQNLKCVVLPNTVTTIGKHAFSNCSDLVSITLSNSLTSIGEYAFYFCPDLKTITIPKSVKTIKGNAFNDCKNLKAIYLEEGSTLTIPSNKWGATNAEIIKIGEKK